MVLKKTVQKSSSKFHNKFDQFFNFVGLTDLFLLTIHKRYCLMTQKEPRIVPVSRSCYCLYSWSCKTGVGNQLFTIESHFLALKWILPNTTQKTGSLLERVPPGVKIIQKNTGLHCTLGGEIMSLRNVSDVYKYYKETTINIIY